MQELLPAIVFLIAGFVLLIYGADFFVSGSSAIAKTLRVPSIVIGLTIVALGTSAPEAAVSITASLAGNSDISISNCIGSNLFNLLVVAGLCAVIHPLPVSSDILRRDFPFSILISALVMLLALFPAFNTSSLTIGRPEGAFMVLLYIIFMIILVRSALKNRTAASEEVKSLPVWKSIFFIVVGCAAIIGGGDFVVNNATVIAKFFHMSDTLIGLTVVALGTSLPELVTSIVASRKGEVDLAMGNVIGSNLANFLIVVGASAALSPVSVNGMLFIDSFLLLLASIAVYVLCLPKKHIGRGSGAFMLLMYAAYTAYIFGRNFL